MRRKFILFPHLLAAAFLWCAIVADAGQPKIARLGLLCQEDTGCGTDLYNALRQRLRDLGYIEGQNILIEERAVESRYERLSEFVSDLVRLKVDVIVTGGSTELLQT